MASPTIPQIAQQIRTAIFGKDVRENIALGIERINENASTVTVSSIGDGNYKLVVTNVESGGS